jgi:hypothetical protein
LPLSWSLTRRNPAAAQNWPAKPLKRNYRETGDGNLLTSAYRNTKETINARSVRELGGNGRHYGGGDWRGSSAQAPIASVTTLKTPWGEPDLQGIWTSVFDTPLQRSPKYADQQFFTEAQRAELDKERAMLVERRRERRTGVGDADVSVGLSLNPTGARTSLIVDPPDARIPSLTPEAEKAAAADREFRLALLQATETCKSQAV